MAGIHLPDIGKLGIHVATGLRDKKKVAPVNMAEEVRLKAFLNRVETEKNERFRVLKKELRRMKRRKKRIDERLEDIVLSKHIPLRIEGKNFSKHTGIDHTHLPPILRTSTSVPKKSPKKLKNRSQDNVTVHVKGSVSKITIFPIQDELYTANPEKPILPPLTPQITQEIACNGTRKTEKSSRKTSNESQMTEISPKKTKRKSLALNNENDATDVPYKNDNRGSRSVSLAVDLDTNLFLSGLESIKIGRRKEPQQSLEDALKAIKACRYIRTPSRQASETDEEVCKDDENI